MTIMTIDNGDNDLTIYFAVDLPLFSTRQYVSVSVFIQEEAGCAY